MNPKQTHFAVFPGMPPPTLVIPQRNEEKGKKNVQFVLPIYSLEHGQTSGGQLLKVN